LISNASSSFTLSDLLGQQPARVADLAGKRHSKRHRMTEPPLIARVCGFQGKYRIFELLERFVCRPIIEVDVCRIVGEQIDRPEFGLMPQQFPSLSCFRPVPTHI
jgi:hypothetical protein